MSAPVEVVAVRDPEGGTDVTMFVGGKRVDDATVYTVDAGRGWDADDWMHMCASHIESASSQEVRACLLAALTDPPGRDHIDGYADTAAGRWAELAD